MASFISFLIVLTFSSCSVDAQSVIWSVPTSGNGYCGEVAETSTPGNLSISVMALVPSFNQRIVSYDVANQPIGVELSFSFDNLGNGVARLVSGGIDFETDSSIIFTVIAIDDTTPTAITGTATCTVNVTDVNDNVPMFAEDHSVINVDDGSIAGTTVGIYTASDADMTSPNNDIIEYILTDGDSNNDMEMAASTGVITVAPGKFLQRTATSTYTLVVTARDGGVPALTGTGTLTVCVGGCSNDCGAIRMGTSLVMTAIFLAVFEIIA